MVFGKVMVILGASATNTVSESLGRLETVKRLTSRGDEDKIDRKPARMGPAFLIRV